MRQVGIRWGLGALVLLAGVTAFAHYPMVETPEQVVGPQRPVTFVITNGHPFMNDRVDAPKLEGVFAFPPTINRGRKLKDAVACVTSQGTKGYAITHTPERSGDWIYSFHCGETVEKPQRRVVDYLKLILHVRHESGAQVGWRRTIGDPLEIVPKTRPYLIPAGSVFCGKVVFNTRISKRDFKSRPFVEGVVEAESYAPDCREGHAYLPENRLGTMTNDKGEFAITLPTPGWWMITVATDGGPGEQGSSQITQRRATLWVKVGGTIYDRFPGSVQVPPKARRARVLRRSRQGKEILAMTLTTPEDLRALSAKLQLLDRMEVDRLPAGEGFVLDTNHMWGLKRAEIREGMIMIEDTSGQVAFFGDTHHVQAWLEQRLSR